MDHARAANHYDMQGHGAKAEEHLHAPSANSTKRSTRCEPNTKSLGRPERSEAIRRQHLC